MSTGMHAMKSTMNHDLRYFIAIILGLVSYEPSRFSYAEIKLTQRSVIKSMSTIVSRVSQKGISIPGGMKLSLNGT